MKLLLILALSWASLASSLPGEKCPPAFAAGTVLPALTKEPYHFKNYRLTFFPEYESAGQGDKKEFFPVDSSFYGVIEFLAGEGKIPQVVAYIGSLSEALGNRYHMGWLLSFEPATLWRALERNRTPGETFFETLNRLAKNRQPGGVNEKQIQLQAAVIVQQFQRYKGKKPVTDIEVQTYFSHQKVHQGVAYAILEKLSSRVPVGTEFEFYIAHQATRASLSRGKKWEETRLGKYAAKAGFDLQDLFRGEPAYRVVVEKKRNPDTVYFP